MRYKGVEVTPVKRPNEPYCNSCGDSGERWKVRVCLDEVGGSTIILCTDCLRALATMSFDVQPERNKIETPLKNIPAYPKIMRIGEEAIGACPVCGEKLKQPLSRCQHCGQLLG